MANQLPLGLEVAGVQLLTRAGPQNPHPHPMGSGAWPLPALGAHYSLALLVAAQTCSLDPLV